MCQVATKFVPNLMSEKEKIIISTHARTFKILRIPFKDNPRRWEMWLWVKPRKPRNRAEDIPLEEPIISMARKGQTNSLKCEGNSHCFYWHSGCCALWVFPQGKSVNQHYCTDTLQQPQANVWQKPPEKWNLEDRFFHHDNALSICEFMAKNKILFHTLLAHQVYYPVTSFPRSQDVINGNKI